MKRKCVFIGIPEFFGISEAPISHVYTFPGTRWRSLVLDDPLQHNDAIHAAAFADLMCNLVVEKGYQILISTHDLAQAEFLRRKFDARKIPCSTLSLLGTGRDGVEWDYQQARLPQRRTAIS